MFAFLCTFITVCASSDEQLTLECVKKYLKDRNAEEDLLSYVNPYVGSLTDCESIVKVKLASITSSLRSRLNSNRLHRPFAECAMRDIEEEDESYELLVLRETAIDMISSWRFWSYWSKSSRIDDLKASANKIVDRSLLKCKGYREFGDLFTNIQEKTVTWDRSGEEEYCIRNHLVEKQLLNPLFYNFINNPKNIKTDNLNCAKVIENVTDRVYAEIKDSKKVSECIIKVYKANNYGDNLLKAEVLSKLNLSKSDKSREKQDFITAMIDITYDAKQC